MQKGQEKRRKHPADTKPIIEGTGENVDRKESAVEKGSEFAGQNQRGGVNFGGFAKIGGRSLRGQLPKEGGDGQAGRSCFNSMRIKRPRTNRWDLASSGKEHLPTAKLLDTLGLNGRWASLPASENRLFSRGARNLLTVSGRRI